jgi:4-amino-4-deoxy-L-arabinose transferase-like glycosyltransferase
LKQYIQEAASHRMDKRMNRKKLQIATIFLGVIFAVCIVIGLSWRIEAVPAMWWDEGWTVSVAKNWVERGFYGLLNSGNPSPPGLAAAFPVVYTVAISFWIFGIGVWQARLPMIFISIGALAAFFALANSLMSRRASVIALAALLFLPGYGELHVLIMGRQVLGEMPALLCLLAGYLCLERALNKRRLIILCSIMFWACALNTKAQILPFFICSLLVPLAFVLYRHKYRLALYLGFALAGSVTASRLLLLMHNLLIQGRTRVQLPLDGIYEVTGLVLLPQVRLSALAIVVTYGLLTVCGLLYGVRKTISSGSAQGMDDSKLIVRVCLLSLGCGWMGWYLLLGSMWFRYLFPAVFIGGIFVAEMIDDLLSDIKPPLRSKLGPIFFIGCLIVYMVTLTAHSLYVTFIAKADASILEAANYLNTASDPDALIETYESELFFLLNRRFHYPPDYVHIELYKRRFSRGQTAINYNPQPFSPDYLVVGKFAKSWNLYEKALENGSFDALALFGDYTVYRRKKAQ